MINFFSKVDKENRTTFMATTTVNEIVKETLLVGVIEELTKRLSDELFKALYPKIEEHLKERLPEITKQLADDVITDIRRKAFKL